MQSKVKIAGHPLHPMLVAFPIASYVFTFASLLAFAYSLDVFWYRLALVANVAGVVTAILAAIPGSVDYATSVPSNSVARRTGAVHGVLNVGALLLFAINLVLLYQQYSAGEAPKLLIGLVLTGGGVLLTVAAGFYGWEMVQRHHVGVQPVADLRTVSHTASEGVIEEAAIEAGTWMDSQPADSTGANRVTDSQVVNDQALSLPYDGSDPEAQPIRSPFDSQSLLTSAQEWLAEEARAEEARAAEEYLADEARAAAELRAEGSKETRVTGDGTVTADLRYTAGVRDLDTGERQRLAEDARVTDRWEPAPPPSDTGELHRH